MMSYNPLNALLAFLLIALLGYVLFRPYRGWFWLLQKNWKNEEKTIMEDVLKQLYRMENSGLVADSNALTNALKINDKLILDALHNLVIGQLAEIDGEQIRLTSEGRQYALRIIRVQRLWEKYLAEKTGFDRSEWHELAEAKEHQLDDDETDKLAQKLGYPIYDPHGDPIPNKKGLIRPLEGLALSQLKEGEVGRIVHIEDEPDVVYRQILAENIHIGSPLRVVEKSPERVVFHAEGEEFVLAPIVASNITVLPAAEAEVITDAVRLSSLSVNESGRIVGISKECRGENRRRLLDLGFVKGSEIHVDLENPLKNPTAYAIKGTSIALRKDQADKILITKE